MEVGFKFANLKQNFGPPKILANEPKVKKSENSYCSNNFWLLKWTVTGLKNVRYDVEM